MLSLSLYFHCDTRSRLGPSVGSNGGKLMNGIYKGDHHHEPAKVLDLYCKWSQF